MCQTGGQDNCNIACTADNVLTDSKKAHIRDTLIPAATAYLTSALDVISVSGNLRVGSDNECTIRDPLTIPPQYLDSGAGVAADIILMVSARPTAGTLLAFAGACKVDQYNRPIVANINFGPSNLKPQTPVDPSELGTAIHELVHGLGFTATGKTGFAKFLDLATNTTRPEAQVIGATVTVGSTNSYSYDAINTTAALAEARAHFGCNSLAGVPLEQQGGLGTARSHWEKRVFWNELMTGTSSADPRVSRITLALLQDSGWYTANFDAAQKFSFGKGKGCSFIDNKCVAGSWPANYICSTDKVRSCNFDRSARSQCQLVEYSSGGPAADMQYFSNPNLGGADSLADFCPMVIEFSNGVCSNTANIDANNDPFFAQVFSRDSVCIDSSIGLAAGEENIRCYRSGCSSATQAVVQVGANWGSCAGGESGLTAAGFSGSWDCPSAEWVTAQCGATASFPTLTAVAPTSIQLTGGESVTLTGSGFTADMYVAIGPVSCNSIVLLSTTEATCTTAPSTIPSSIAANIATVPRTAAIIRADASAATLANAATVVTPSPAVSLLPASTLVMAASLLAALAMLFA
ncbi:uncharacterized protein AMSG_09673 [Thecamonas trahens ATCC 50062]|uniref:IPT/TIG domain-containing protein n=1 Tax=Thecamonas trahens ATCC 50062 TaxID=461836 RepID=A0A0L0DPS2_THETB|nr:hypothetical protein AMSG_09673 [Thecamonas trahens ATCC 50062]KNC54016.1 hypothetical protein AMSG_09673 [Thecamonas trahens ATCC 50062]|eukprot:XP_013754031.1 hypothetical protein AMSG_09673 [Thecamonas trahens ATCC 50062]